MGCPKEGVKKENKNEESYLAHPTGFEPATFSFGN